MPSVNRLRLRRIFRFSLRTLLLFMVVVCVFFGTVMQRAQKQKHAVERVHDLGGYVTYDFQRTLMDKNRRVVDQNRKNLMMVITRANLPAVPQNPTVPSWLRKLFGDDVFKRVVTVRFDIDSGHAQQFSASDLDVLRDLPNLDTLVIRGAAIIDESSAPLTALKNLEELGLQGTDVSSIGFITSMTKLRTLSLAETCITDDGLIGISKLHGLEELDLSGTIVGDEGLQEISTLVNLRSLSISDTAVTDTGLAHLVNMNALRQLDCRATRTSDEAVSELGNRLNLTSSGFVSNRIMVRQE
jgi:Leucine-rich repeat (LRR) protein